MSQLDPKEADRLVDTYSDMILRISWHYLRSAADADDICQNVFLKLLSGNYSFESPEHEKAWIIRTAINACKDELRQARRNVAALDESLKAAAEEPAAGEVLDAVKRLPLKYREVIYLYYYESYSVKEIAELLGKSQDAVMKQLSRGRKKLREFLEDENG